MSTNNPQYDHFFRSLQVEAEKLCQAIQPLLLVIERIGRTVQEINRQLNESEFGSSSKKDLEEGAKTPSYTPS